MRFIYLADIRFPMERANGIQTIETCHALARRGVDVELVVRRTDDRSDAACLEFFGLAQVEHLRLRRVDTSGRLGFLARAIPLLLGAKKTDIVYTRDLVIADLALKITSAAVVYEAHTVASVFAEERSRLYEDVEPPSPAKLRRLDRREARVWRRASGTAAITTALLNALDERHGKSACSIVVPDGCRFVESMPPTETRDKVYYIGQLYPWKGIDVLVQAMVDVNEAELVVVGGLPPEPDLERVKRLAQELRLDDKVSFRGFVPPPELDRERQQASMFVIPNLDSTTARLFTSPLKLFEAMASGRPIIASDLASMRELLTHEENALLVPAGDAHALAGAITRIAKDEELAARLARRAFDDVKAYTWERRAEAIETFARGLVE